MNKLKLPDIDAGWNTIAREINGAETDAMLVPGGVLIRTSIISPAQPIGEDKRTGEVYWSQTAIAVSTVMIPCSHERAKAWMVDTAAATAAALSKQVEELQNEAKRQAIRENLTKGVAPILGGGFAP